MLLFMFILVAVDLYHWRYHNLVYDVTHSISSTIIVCSIEKMVHVSTQILFIKDLKFIYCYDIHGPECRGWREYII